MSQRGADGDERGQILVLGSQAIRHPGTHARPNELIAPGVELEQRAAVGWVRAMDRPQNAEVVDMLGDIGKQLAHRQPALAVSPELPGRLQQVPRFREGNARKLEWRCLPVVTCELRLGIEGVDMRWSAFHEQEDDAFCTGMKVGNLRR